MKEPAVPLTPLALPDWARPPGKPKIVKRPNHAASRKLTSGRKPGRTTRRRPLAPQHPAFRLARKVRRTAQTWWQQFKRGINSGLAHLDRQKLKQVLIAGGVVAAAATGIFVLVKLTPFIMALLALLGLGAGLRLWDRLRNHRPD